MFLSQISNSYTKYFNTKYKRIGPLFQGAFKAVLVENEEQLIHLSRYIHLNPVVSQITKSLDDYPWSSYHEYMRGDEFLCSIRLVLKLFPSKEKYKQFLENQVDYGIALENIKRQIFNKV